MLKSASSRYQLIYVYANLRALEKKPGAENYSPWNVMNHNRESYPTFGTLPAGNDKFKPK